MTMVATLVTDAADPSLTDTDLRQAASELPNASPAIWLDEGVAARISFAPSDGAIKGGGWRATLTALLVGRRIDIAVLPASPARKMLLLADMDSTLIHQECIDELAELVGRREQVAAITKRSVDGSTDFDKALRERVSLLRGLHVASASRAVRNHITLMAGAQVLARTMRAHGALTIIASGGFDFFTSAVAEWAGFDAEHANRLEVADGRFTGRLLEPILGPGGKRDLLRRLREERGLSPEETLAVGDGANDIPMLREAGLGVAFRARPNVTASADAIIEHGDLTALLYLQGYRRAEFVA